MVALVKARSSVEGHRFIKRRISPGLSFSSFNTAWRTLQGYEAMAMIRKGQIHGVKHNDITGQISFIHCIFGLAA